MKPLAAATAARSWSALALAPSTGGGVGGSLQADWASAGPMARNNAMMQSKIRIALSLRLSVSHGTQQTRQMDAGFTLVQKRVPKVPEFVRNVSRTCHTGAATAALLVPPAVR